MALDGARGRAGDHVETDADGGPDHDLRRDRGGRVRAGGVVVDLVADHDHVDVLEHGDQGQRDRRRQRLAPEHPEPGRDALPRPPGRHGVRTRTASTAAVNAIASGVPRYAPAAPRPAATSTSPITSRPAASRDDRHPDRPELAQPRRGRRAGCTGAATARPSARVAAAAQYASTPIARASGSRNSAPASASAIVSSASRTVQRRIVALSSPCPPSVRVATARAVATWSAEPGTEKIRKRRERRGQDAVVRGPEHAREDRREDHGDAVGDELRRGETGGGGRLRAARNGGPAKEQTRRCARAATVAARSATDASRGGYGGTPCRSLRRRVSALAVAAALALAPAAAARARARATTSTRTRSATSSRRRRRRRRRPATRHGAARRSSPRPPRTAAPPSSTPEPEHTLPYTGIDGWPVAIAGALLLGAGLTLRVALAAWTELTAGLRRPSAPGRGSPPTSRPATSCSCRASSARGRRRSCAARCAAWASRARSRRRRSSSATSTTAATARSRTSTCTGSRGWAARIPGCSTRSSTTTRSCSSSGPSTPRTPGPGGRVSTGSGSRTRAATSAGSRST